MIRAARPFIVEQEAQQVELIEALSANGGQVAEDLAERLSRCRAYRAQLRSWGGKPDLHHELGSARYRCGLHACWSCSRRLVRKIGAKAAERFEDADHRWCSAVTVGIALTGDLTEVREAVVAFRRALRDRRDATARIWSRWAEFEVKGHAEVDAHWLHDVQQIAPKRLGMIQSLPVLAHCYDDAPIWVIHSHLVCHHPEIGRGEVDEVFSHQWPGANRVHVQPFFEHQLPSYAAGHFVSYSAKNSQCSTVGDLKETWPVSWKAAYWTWQHGMRRGLQPLHVSLGARRPNVSLPAMAQRQRSSEFVEPMPIVFGEHQFLRNSYPLLTV